MNTHEKSKSISELIEMAHTSIQRTKGTEYAPDVHEVESWINQYRLENNLLSAVDFFKTELVKVWKQAENLEISIGDFSTKLFDTYQQAKQMEEAQKKRDFIDGYKHSNQPLNHDLIDKWYNDTYKNK